MKRYILIKGDEDGNPVKWLDPGEINAIAQLREDYSIEEFMNDVPPAGERNPSYWRDGIGLLLEVRVLRVRPKETVTEWVVE